MSLCPSTINLDPLPPPGSQLKLTQCAVPDQGIRIGCEGIPDESTPNPIVREEPHQNFTVTMYPGSVFFYSTRLTPPTVSLNVSCQSGASNDEVSPITRRSALLFPRIHGLDLYREINSKCQ